MFCLEEMAEPFPLPLYTQAAKTVEIYKTELKNFY